MYYTIQNGSILTAENREALAKYYNNVQVLPSDYELGKYIVQDGELVLNENYEAEQAQKERERIAMLSLTRGDVFRGLLLARGVTRLQLRGMIEANELLTEVQKEMALIDFDEALNFYRGNALIDTVGLALGIEPAQLDCFFQTNDYTCLLPKEEPEEPVEEVQDDSSATDTTEPNISV